VPGLAENKPSVLRGDRLYATVKKGSVKYKYEGYIHRIALNNISIGFNKKLVCIKLNAYYKTINEVVLNSFILEI